MSGKDFIPKGWSTITIGELCQLTNGRAFKPVEWTNSGLPIVRIQNLNNPKATFNRFDGPVDDKFFIDTGDLLFAWSGTPGTSFGAHIWDRGPAVLNQHIFRITFDDSRVEKRYLRLAINQRLDHLVSISHGGAGLAHVTKPVFQATTILLPPLPEQHRIVAKIEALTARSRRAKQALDAIPPLLERFRQSILAAAFRGDLTATWRTQNPNIEPATELLKRIHRHSGNVRLRRGVPTEVIIPDYVDQHLPRGWALESVASLLQYGAIIDLKDGNHGANHPGKNDFSQEGLPFITAAQVNHWTIDYQGAPKIAGSPLGKLRVGFCEPDDVVFTHKGTVGRAAIAEHKCVLTPQTTYYRSNLDVLRPKYLMYQLGSNVYQAQYSLIMSQTTRNFVPITEQYRLFLRIPPVAEQIEIETVLEKLLLRAADFEAAYIHAVNLANRFDQSILAKAFCGDLVS